MLVNKWMCYGIWHSSNVVSKIKGRVIKLAHRLLIERAKNSTIFKGKSHGSSRLELKFVVFKPLNNTQTIQTGIGSYLKHRLFMATE